MADANATTRTPLTSEFFGADDFIKKRDIREQVYGYIPYSNFMDFLFNTGKDATRKVKAVSSNLHHYEEDDLFVVPTILAGATGGGSAGAPVTFSIAAIGSAGAYVQPFVVGDIVQIGSKANGFKKGMITAIVEDTAAGTHDYTVTPTQAAVQIAPADAAAGEEVRYISHAQADGAFFPKSKLSQLVRYSTKMQIYAEAFKRHGSESADVVEVKIDGKPYLFYRGIAQAYERMAVDIAMQTLIGDEADNLLDPNHPDGDNIFSINTNEGLEQKIANDGGIEYPYTTSFDYADLQALDKLIDVVHGPHEYMGQVGIDFEHGFDDNIFTKLENTGSSFTAFQSGPSVDMKKAAEIALSLRFRTVAAGSRVWHIQKNDVLNSKNLLNGTGYPEMGFFIPSLVYQGASSDEDMRLGITTPYDAICIRYKDNGVDGSRMARVVDQNPKELGADSYKKTLLMEMAVQFGAIRKFARAYL